MKFTDKKTQLLFEGYQFYELGESVFMRIFDMSGNTDINEKIATFNDSVLLKSVLKFLNTPTHPFHYCKNVECNVVGPEMLEWGDNPNKCKCGFTRTPRINESEAQKYEKQIDDLNQLLKSAMRLIRYQEELHEMALKNER